MALCPFCPIISLLQYVTVLYPNPTLKCSNCLYSIKNLWSKICWTSNYSNCKFSNTFFSKPMSSTRDVGANNLFWVKKLKIVHDSIKTYDILIKKVLENLFTFIYSISRKKIWFWGWPMAAQFLPKYGAKKTFFKSFTNFFSELQNYEIIYIN